MLLNEPDEQGKIPPDALAGAMQMFLERVSAAFAGDLNRAAEHLRYPADSKGTLTGSALGMELWESEEGRSLVELFLRDQQLREWFGERPIELRSAIASVVKSWAASGEPPRLYSTQNLSAVLESLKEETKSGWAIGVAYGVRVPRRVDLPNGFAIEPDVDTMLRHLVTNGALDETQIIRMPKGYSCLLLHGSSVPRSIFGPFAGTTATVWPQVALHRLRTSIWMASGALPTVGDIFLTEQSAYPVTPLTHVPAPVQVYPQTLATTMSQTQLIALADIILKVDALSEGMPHMDIETDVQLRLALSHTESVLRTSDSLLAALLIYVAIDGLLLYPDDDISRLVPRLAWLIGVSNEERRQLRRFMQAFGEVRGDVGHGNPPAVDTLSRLLGREVTVDEVDAYFLWVGHDAGRLLETKCRELFRKVLVALLNLALDVRHQSVSARLTRRNIIDLLESAARGHPGAPFAVALLETNARTLP